MDLPAAWINPEHIVQVVPLIDGRADAKRLTVEVKLVGLSIIRAHFGTYESMDAVDTRWRNFSTSSPRMSLKPPRSGVRAMTSSSPGRFALGGRSQFAL
jgi:hypothetical protein